MENWGLVTYRVSCVLVYPANTSSASKQWVAIVVDHEMAHVADFSTTRRHMDFFVKQINKLEEIICNIKQ